jgi:hypothetical protein
VEVVIDHELGAAKPENVGMYLPFNQRLPQNAGSRFRLAQSLSGLDGAELAIVSERQAAESQDAI